MWFRPDYWFRNVLSIDEAFLRENGIKGMILDLDNTLSKHGDPAAEEGIPEWLEKMRNLDIRMVVVSNNTKRRVAPLAKKLGIEFISMGCKPLSFGIRRGIRKLGVTGKETVVVGDQILTDVLGGKSCGIRTILVEPFSLEEGRLLLLFKRKLETLFFKRDYSKLERK